jgi:Nucleotidyltransferase domain
MHALIQARLPAGRSCRQYGVRQLELFGSAASGRNKVSDLDFLVEFHAPDPNRYADVYFGLLETWNGCLAYPRRPDHDLGHYQPYFLRNIARSRTLA